MEYIAGRPFAVNGDHVEPGDTMTKAQLDSIPYIESFINSGYIYAVYTDKDYDRLPPHIFTTVMLRREAEVAMTQKVAMETEDQRKQQEAGDADDSRALAATEARIADKSLIRNFVRRVDPTKVKTEEEAKKEQAEALKEMREKENILTIPDQTPADEKDATPVPVEEPQLEPAPEPVKDEPKAADKKNQGK
jgi:hypothetical protein